jgi:hypothetical protein
MMITIMMLVLIIFGFIWVVVTVRAISGRLSGLSVLHSKSTFYGAFVLRCRARNSPKRWVWSGQGVMDAGSAKKKKKTNTGGDGFSDKLI